MAAIELKVLHYYYIIIITLYQVLLVLLNYAMILTLKQKSCDPLSVVTIFK